MRLRTRLARAERALMIPMETFRPAVARVLVRYVPGERLRELCTAWGAERGAPVQEGAGWPADVLEAVAYLHGAFLLDVPQEQRRAFTEAITRLLRDVGLPQRMIEQELCKTMS
jgi:hypothetical protein